jgi:hypothetical protein
MLSPSTSSLESWFSADWKSLRTETDASRVLVVLHPLLALLSLKHCSPRLNRTDDDSDFVLP